MIGIAGVVNAAGFGRIDEFAPRPARRYEERGREARRWNTMVELLYGRRSIEVVSIDAQTLGPEPMVFGHWCGTAVISCDAWLWMFRSSVECDMPRQHADCFAFFLSLSLSSVVRLRLLCLSRP